MKVDKKTYLISGALVLLLILGCFLFLNKPGREVINPNENSGENNISLEESELTYGLLSGDKYEINYSSNKIIFSGDLDIKGSFCVTSNPDGPKSGDEWIDFDENKIYELSLPKNDLISGDNDEVKKVYVKYKVSEGNPMASIKVSAVSGNGGIATASGTAGTGSDGNPSLVCLVAHRKNGNLVTEHIISPPVEQSDTYQFKIDSQGYHQIVVQFDNAFLSGGKEWLAYHSHIFAYKVIYNTNEGSGGPGSEILLRDYNNKLSTSTPTRSGYEFLGWSTSLDATTAEYQAGANFNSELPEDYSGSGSYTVNIYAVWAEIPKPTGSVKIKGTNTYGETLTVDTSLISPTGCTLTYQWWYSTSSTATSGTNIPGATSSTLFLDNSTYVGKYIGVTVTASKTNYTSNSFTDITDATNNVTAPVSKASISPTVSMSGYTYGGTKSSPSISGNTGNGTVTYYYNTSNSNSGGTAWSNVSSSTSLNAGTYYMYARVAATTTYEGATTAAVSFRIAKATGYVNLSATSGTITYGTATKQFTVSSHHGGTLSVEERTSTAATVSRSGSTVTISTLGSLNAGTTVTVRVTSAATTNYNSAYRDYTLTVNKASISPTVSMSGYTYGGTKSTPSISGNKGNGTVTYYYNTSNSNSGGTAWSTVTSSTSLNAGTYYMYATVAETTDYKEATTTTVAFTIDKATPTLTLEKTTTRIVKGNSETITYTYIGDGALTVKTSDSTKATATVNTTNKTITVKTIGIDSATITLSAAEGTNYVAKTAMLTVSIPQANYSIDSIYYETLEEAYNSITGTSATIKVEESNTDNTPVTIENGKDIIIDLNGKTITVDGITGGGFITNDGTLQIIDNGTNGAIKDTSGTAIVNNGKLTIGDNKGTEDESKPRIEGKDYAVKSEGKEFNFDSGTVVGKIEPPYTGEPKVPKEYYIKTEKFGDRYESVITKDNTPPRIYAEDIEPMVIGSGKTVTINIFVEEPESKMNPNEFTSEDLIFEVNGKVVQPEELELIYIQEIDGTYKYILRFQGIREDGDLVIRIEQDKVFNIAQMGNEATIILKDKIKIDYKVPDLSNAEIELVEPEDGITNTGEYEVKISGVTDNYGIGEYQWEIKRKEDKTWDVIETIPSNKENSFISGKLEEEGTYEIRVRVEDINGNYTYSNLVEVLYEKITNFNAKPSIRFEKEVVRSGNKITSVNIHAIVKSTTKIVSASVNNIPIGIDNTIVEGKYQIRTELVYEAFVNTIYKFTVKDELNNVVSEVYNVMDISKEGAKVGYKIVNATAYEPAKIVFSSNEEVKLVTELSGRFYASKNYNTTYSKEIIVNVSGDAGSLDDTFVFEDTLGNMTNVHVIGDIDVSNRYIVTVKTPAKSIYDTYGKEITLGRANSLVVKMKNAKKVNSGKVSAYYGLDFTEIRTSVSTEDDFNVAKTLGGAISLQVANRDRTVVELQKGNVEIVTAAQGSASSVNGNLTGIYIESGLVTGGGNEDDKGSSFHVTIINR